MKAGVIDVGGGLRGGYAVGIFDCGTYPKKVS